jgi:hypothetical protein
MTAAKQAKEQTMNDSNTSVTTRNATAVSTPTGNPFAEYAESVLQRTIAGKLLKFSKGDWLAGQDNDEIPKGTKFVANMAELYVGWQRWEDNKPTDQVMGKAIEGYKPVLRSSLPDQDREQWEVDADGKERDPWVKTNYLLLKGVHDGELYTFTTSSKGGLDAIARLCKDYVPLWQQRPNDWPVIEIGGDAYAHPNKDFGRIKVPTFKIVSFEPKTAFAPDLGEQHQVVMDDNADVDEFPEPEAKPAPKPAAKKNRI